jgi:2-oxoisovalerate dehydrogenase E2 component (dihydrolipoyl transacylase)
MKIFNLPDLGEGLAEAEIVRWHVKPGDHVNVDDPMLAVETAKAIVEVPSPFSGVIKTLHGNPGDTVATGGLLVEFEPDARATGAPTSSAAAPHASAAARTTSASAWSATAAAPAATGTRAATTAAPGTTAAALGTTAGTLANRDAGTVVGSMPTDNDDFVFGVDPNTNVSATTTNADRVRAIPAARALAKRLAIDITQVRGTGRGGLVTVDDVLSMTAPVAPGAYRQTIPGSLSTVGRLASGALPHNSAAAEERLKGPRRAMAQSMVASRDNVMGCTVFDDADLHGWQPEQDITSRILRAIAEGCTAEPGLNAWFDGESLTRQVLTQIDVAIAVDTPEGLIVPVVRNIGIRPVAELRQDIDRLKRETRQRSVRAEDLRNFTFMLSNFGMIAGRYATPVVVPPAVAILGCGRLSHDVIAIQTDRIEAHLRMPLSLTFDHRCVTGGEAARFLAAVIRDLQKGN